MKLRRRFRSKIRLMSGGAGIRIGCKSCNDDHGKQPGELTTN
jgi:hypothetical protein